MTKVLSQTGLTELIQLSKNEFLPKSGAVEATTVSLATVATSGSYNDLSNKPTIPTVNNATLTIQKNSTDVATFTANASSNVTANISVPTKVSDLSNDSGFITGITSSDVTTALGYTPYDSSNPSGYTSNVGTVTSVNNVSPVSGNVTLSIPTVNDATLTITQGGVSKGTFTANASSNVTIDLDSGGSADIDNLSITTNSSDELQAVGVINKNTASGAVNPKYDWVGTLEEYETQQVETLHPDWICYITDDVQGGTSVYTKNQVNSLLSVKANSADVYTKNQVNSLLSVKANSADVYTKAETNNLLSTKTDSTDVNNAITAMLGNIYPVGSIYIGTTSTCPIASLISGSTWTLVSSDRVLQGSSGSHIAGSTIEAGLPNITGTVATPTSSDASDTGAFHDEGNDPNSNWGGNSSWNNNSLSSFNASRSSSIYGNSSTVQPPAYVVNIWQRTA